MRSLLVIAGLAVLAGAWLGPLPTASQSSFTAHMTMHVMIVAAAAPLLALAIAGSARDPVPGHEGWFAALPASLIELFVVWAWHTPHLHALARTSDIVFAFEQGSFLAVGMLLWLSAFGGRPDDGRTAATGIVALLLTSMHMTLLGTLLALATRPLYAHAAHGLEDQQLGGVVMLLGGGLAYLAGGLALLARLLRKPVVATVR
jgi:putative membrane protein